MATDWITLSQTGGTGNTIITVTPQINQSLNARSLNIIFSAENNTVTVSVFQSGNPSNVITYYAPAKLLEVSGSGYTSGLHIDQFTPPLASSGHTFENGVGTLTFSENVTEIGYLAFYDCSGMTNIEIPTSVNTISANSFSNCTDLLSIELPQNLSNLGQAAFSNCSQLTGLTIPSGITTIPGYLCIGCSELRTVDLPSNLTFIGYYSFKNCTSLTGVTIPSGVTRIAYQAFYGCSALREVIDMSGISEIGEEAFYQCTNLSSITFTFDSFVPIIQTMAFAYCTSLSSVTINNENPVHIKANTFALCTGLITADLNISYLGEGAFYKCQNLVSANIRSSGSSIHSERQMDKYCFSGCTNLTNVTIGENVNTLSYGAFLGCTSLSAITLPNSLTKIGGIVFKNCSSLTSLTLPPYINHIYSEVFAFTPLTELYYNNTKSNWYSVTREPEWKKNSNITVIHCTDGDISV